MAPVSLCNSTFFVSMKHQNNQLLPHSVAHKSNITAFQSLESRASPAVMTPFKNFQPRSPALNISQTFIKLRQQSKVALIPYITAGDPDLSTTAEALKLLDTCGSDVIKLGVPNSDPIFDGPVIQLTFEAPLADNKVAPQISCPITLFTYHNVIIKHGTRKFFTDLNDAGVHGLDPDAPLAESEILRKEASKNEIEMQLLTTPITPTEQMKTIAEAAEGFLYLVSSVGATGARASVNPRVESLLREIKKETRKPVVVGFGISKPEHVKQVAGWGADGVIVGSAIVKLLGEAKSPKEGLKEIERFTKSLKSALP